jgi:hypothetical protein
MARQQNRNNNDLNDGRPSATMAGGNVEGIQKFDKIIYYL